MGAKQRRLSKLFRENPICFNCGVASSDTEDHVPARSFFKRRQWAQGWSFAACKACNTSSSSDEAALGWLLKITDLSSTSEELEKSFRQMRHLFGDKPALGDTEHKYVRINGVHQRMVQVKLSPHAIEKTGEPSKRALRKIFKAIYYYHVRKPFPLSAHLDFAFKTQSDQIRGDFLKDAHTRVFQEPKILSHQNEPLDGQFRYSTGQVIGFDVALVRLWLRGMNATALLSGSPIDVVLTDMAPHGTRLRYGPLTGFSSRY